MYCLISPFSCGAHQAAHGKKGLFFHYKNYTQVQWLALLQNSRRVVGFIPGPGIFLCLCKSSPASSPSPKTCMLG